MRISDWSSDVCSSDLVETPARIEEPDARGKEENARAEIAAKQQLVDRHGLGRGANPPATELAKGLGEGRGIGGDARRVRLVEDPRRTMRIEATGRDLVEHVGEARRIGRVRAAPPQLANGETQRIVEREQSNPSFAPASGALIAPVTF